MDKTISFYIAYIYKDFLEYGKNKLKEIGVSYGQIPFIIYIGKYKGCSAKEVKEGLKADWGHTQRMIDRLLDNALVNKEADEADRRLYHLSLTDKGYEAFSLAHEVFYSYDESIKAKLSMSEALRLNELLVKLVDNKEIINNEN